MVSGSDNYKKIKKINWVCFVIACDVLFFWLNTLGNGLVNSKKDMCIGWYNTATLAHLLTVYFDEFFFVWIKSVNGLVGQDIAIR